MRRHFRMLRPAFEGDFGSFLSYTIAHSGYDATVVQLFRHSVGGYKFEGDYEVYIQELQAYSDEHISSE